MVRPLPVEDRMRFTTEDGVSLVELLVALFVLAIVLAGTTAGVASSLQLTNDSRAATVASGLASASLEAALAADFTDIEGEVVTPVADEVQVIDGRQYTVSRDVSWVTSSSVTGACAGVATANDTDVLLIDVTVDWVGRTQPQPMGQETTVSPPVGLYDPNAGTMAIYVSDAQEPSQPVSGVTVTITGPLGQAGETTMTLSTNVDGCAVFQNIDAGDYDVSIAKANHVDFFQRTAPDVTETIGVGVASRVTHEFRYAPTEYLDLVVVGREGGLLPPGGLTGQVATTSDTFDVGPVAPGGATTAVPLWPASYQSWVGGCDTADPEGRDDSDALIWLDGDRGPATATGPVPGSVVHTITAGTLEVTWGADWTPGDTYELVAVSRDNCDDAADQRISLGNVTTGLVGATAGTFVLPWGSWELSLLDGDGNPVGDSPDAAVLDPATPGAGALVLVKAADYCTVVPHPFLRYADAADTDTVAGDDDADDRIQLTVPPSTQEDDLVVVTTLGEQSDRWLEASGDWTLVRRGRNNDSNVEMSLWTRRAPAGYGGQIVELELEYHNGVYMEDYGDEPHLAQIFTIANAGAVQDHRKVDLSSWDDEASIGDVDVAVADSLVLVVAGAYDGGHGLDRVDDIDPGSGAPIVEVGYDRRNLLTTYGVLSDPPSSSDYDVQWDRESSDRFIVVASFDSACS